jgi:iron complex outermembrane receptor protein
MKALISAALAGASLLAIASSASAASAPAAAAVASADDTQLGEIVVTARRRSESLQEVPQTVSAVTADTLQKLNIKQFQDVQSLVPGLSLQADSTGYNASASLRGVTYNVNSQAQPTVALYMNDAPIQATFLFHSLFDIGQVEVLKGPQGTNRGISAPSGAITITTHKADLDEFGGFVDGTLTDLQGRNFQGAINIPIIKDVLAVRVAGVIDQNRADGVTSIHSNIEPSSTTSAERITVDFEPSDRFNAVLMYQHMDQSTKTFQQVSGPGAGVFTIGDTVFPASVNPPIGPTDRLAVQDSPNDLSVHFDTLTAQIDSRIFGQHLSYVGSYQHQKLDDFAEGGGSSAGDVGNVLPGIAISQAVHDAFVETTHEIRLASDPAPGRFFDYTVGAFYQWQNPTGTINDPQLLLPGAFGPGAGSLSAFNRADLVYLNLDIPSFVQETSIFGSVTLHLGPNTELSGGIRHIWSVVGSNQTFSLLGTQVGGAPNHASDTPNIYNVSLSHHFTRDFLVYVNTGTSYRPGGPAVGVQGQLLSTTDPLLSGLNFRGAERSRAYEIGFKSTWLDGRARLNASIFRQRFTNLPDYIPGISYNNVADGQPLSAGTPTNFSFTAPVDALVQGFDIDTALQVTRDWSIAAQMSYADGKVQGTLVPCNVAGANGQPVYNTAGLISLCPGGSVSQLPLWNASFQSEYTHPINDDLNGFFRVLATYYPQNKNRAEPNFTVDQYSLLNLYLGVRSRDGAWEASLFARNALNAQRALDVQGVQTNLPLTNLTGLNFAHNTGYYQTLMTPEREVGINVHYSWGSR